MDEKALARLEFHKIRQRLAAATGSPLGREHAEALCPLTDETVIGRLQEETAEVSRLHRLEPSFEPYGWHDIREILHRATQGGILDGISLYQVGETLAASSRIKKFFAARKAHYPLLSGVAEKIADLRELERRILQTVLPGGEVQDNATPELAGIRSRLTRARVEIKEVLERFVRQPSNRKYLQDALVTIREGRYVVPVKQEYRKHVPGIVHDQSASGSTLFIEPLPVVEKNNLVRRLETAERREVEKILADLTRGVAAAAEEIAATLESLGRLDFMLAKGRLALSMNAVPPTLSGRAWLDIRGARHPLIPGRAVPIDIRLGTDFHTLIITGPNTGGKTVTIKTAGLLVLMAQAGLHVPAEVCSMGIFRQVFADVGDEQSIEDSLSTFSSHIRNISGILQKADQDSLVLLDELGAGTDPTEGAALGRAILEALHARGVRTVATTHFAELKEFASALPGAANASVAFDARTLEPTYRLVIGRPGRSYAFAMAERLGLPPEVVARARGFLKPEQIRVEALLGELEKAQDDAVRKREEARTLRAAAYALKKKYEEEWEAWQTRKARLWERTVEEAESELRRVRREAEAIIRSLRKQTAAESARVRERAIQEARERLRLLQAPRAVDVGAETKGDIPRDLQPGETVYLPRYGQYGSVVQPARGREVLVQVGALKVNLPLTDVQRAPQAPATGRTAAAALALEKVEEIKNELDLRGRRVEEAIIEADKYIDNAVVAGLTQVYLIHGKGTGALRNALHEMLREDPRVKEFRLGDYDEGGSGVTVVTVNT
ncbi:MAG: endonuclease MutS2 [Desulfotomaculales bacterium]